MTRRADLDFAELQLVEAAPASAITGGCVIKWDDRGDWTIDGIDVRASDGRTAGYVSVNRLDPAFELIRLRIEQNHREEIEALVEKGRTEERLALARAH